MKTILKNAFKETITKKNWNFYGGSIGSLLALSLAGKFFFLLIYQNQLYLV